MTRRIRVGVVGCGLIAQVMHLPYLRELEDLYEIGAVCDLRPRTVEQVGERFGVERRLTRWEDVLAEPLDAVMVLTTGSHAPAAVGAARAGLHVFVEKPLAVSVQEGQEVLAAAREAGVTLMVGYMKRYDPAYERLFDELASFEDIRLVRTTTLESPWQPYVAHHPLVPWEPLPDEVTAELAADRDRRVRAALGDVDPMVGRVYHDILTMSMVHELNGIRGLLGEPDRVEFADLRPEGVVTVLSFGGARCVASWVHLPGMARYRQEWAFFSPDRRAYLVFPSPYLRNMPTRLLLEGGTPGTRSWRTVETASFEEAFKRELVEFHASVTSGREPRTSGLDGLRDIALCHAIATCFLEGSPRARPTAVTVDASP